MAWTGPSAWNSERDSTKQKQSVGIKTLLSECPTKPQAELSNIKLVKSKEFA